MNYVYAALLAAALAFGAAWTVQGWRYDEKIATMKQDAAEETTKAVKGALETERKSTAKVNDALSKAQDQARKNAASAAAAHRTAISLREQLTVATGKLSQASCSASRNYATTLAAVFGECTKRLEDMAGQANGHATDSLMLQRAWN